MVKSILRRFNSERKYFSALIRDNDLRFFSEYEINKSIYPENSNFYHIEKCIHQLKNSFLSTDKKGFASKYDFVTGKFGPLYPEVTGYIINTLYALKDLQGGKFFEEWMDEAIISSVNSLKNCQLSDGSFTGGHKDMINYGNPSIFNTGQILLGLTEHFIKSQSSELESIIEKGVTFLNDNATENGYNPNYCYNSRFAPYYSRATYGHISAGIAINNQEAKIKSKNVIDYILKNQTEVGDIKGWGFANNWYVLHTVIYTLRGIYEVGSILDEKKYIEASHKGMTFLENTANRIVIDDAPISNGDLFEGSKIKEICFTGLGQQAILANKLIKKGYHLNEDFHIKNPMRILKQHQIVGCDNKDIEGSLPGCKPLNGKYQPLSAPIWGIKFYLDALIYEVDNQIDIKG